MAAKFYSLLIGIGDYLHPRYADLPATVRDAQAIAAMLTEPNRCGYPQGEESRFSKGNMRFFASAQNDMISSGDLSRSFTPLICVAPKLKGRGNRVEKPGRPIQ
jgi:hypothetical protein